MSSEPELLPCPFCGGVAVTYHGPVDYYWHGVKCSVCLVRVARWDLESAIVMWNSRASLAAPGAPEEPLRAEILAVLNEFFGESHHTEHSPVIRAGLAVFLAKRLAASRVPRPAEEQIIEIDEDGNVHGDTRGMRGIRDPEGTFD